MDKQGFRTMLEGRKVPAEKMESALELAERFEQFAEQTGGFSTATAWAFSNILIAEGQNSEENFITLARYGLFIKNNAVFVAFLEVLDGGEAQENLYSRVAERYGEALRDEVFAGIGVAPFGLPTPEKPRTMQPVIARLEQALGAEACRSAHRRQPARSAGRILRQRTRAVPVCRTRPQDVDEYIARKKQGFVAQLAACQREGRLFFAQEITDEVLAFVRDEPEIGGGVRAGNVVYETKIPFLTKEYLAETDPTLKRYYYCHCPWACEAIRSGEKSRPSSAIAAPASTRSPGKPRWAKRSEVDVLESVLAGADRCRFAIHLPV